MFNFLKRLFFSPPPETGYERHLRADQAEQARHDANVEAVRQKILQDIASQMPSKPIVHDIDPLRYVCKRCNRTRAQIALHPETTTNPDRNCKPS